MAATISWDTAALWNIETGTTVAAMHTARNRNEGAVDCLAVSPDGRVLATTDSKTVRLWNAKTGKLARELARSTLLHARNIRFSDDGRWIAAAGVFAVGTTAAGVWECEGGRNAAMIVPERQSGDFPVVAFSPDGRRIAAGFASDGFTGVWEVPERPAP